MTKPREFDAALLFELCASFSMGDEKTFKSIVEEFIDLSGIAQKDLARDCKVSVSTISRWTRGASIPGPHVQVFVVRKIQNRLQPAN
jgi:hypothetical protein